MYNLTHYDLEIKGTDSAAMIQRIAGKFNLTPDLKNFLEELITVAKAEWGDDIWKLFDENAELKILKVNKWFLSFTFRVKHCEPVVRFLIGPRPLTI